MRKIAWWLCAILCLAFLWLGCATQKSVRSRETVKSHRLSQSKENAALFKVSGLDEDSVSKIKSNLKKLDAVQSVQVDVKKGTVKVILKENKTASVSQLKKAIEQSGYRVQQTLQSPLELGQLEKRMP